MKKDIYLVTGAAGFLGNNIVSQLISRNEQVRALVLQNDPAAKELPNGVEIFSGDITNLESVRTFFDVPADIEVNVIHCASLVTTLPEKNEKVYDVNVIGTKNIVDICVEKKVKKLVYISSTGAILELPNGESIKEPFEFFPEKVVGYYAFTKALATEYVFESAKNRGLNASVIYPSGISGPNDSSYGPFVSFIIRYCKGEMPIGVEGTFNAVDVRDLAMTTIDTLTKGRQGEGYIISNEMVDMESMFKLISEKSGAPLVKKIVTPTEMIDLSVESFASTDPKAGSEALKFELYNLTRNNLYDCTKAKKELDYQPRSFEETIQDTIIWLKKEKKI